MISLFIFGSITNTGGSSQYQLVLDLCSQRVAGGDLLPVLLRPGVN